MKRILALLSAALLLWVQPAAAQSILRDAETEALLNDMQSRCSSRPASRPPMPRWC